VHFMAEQVKENILSQQKMQLTLPDLNRFLKFEGMLQGEDAKSAIERLLELRSRQLSHLGRYAAENRTAPVSSHIPDDTSFKLELALLPAEKVHDCFAAEAEKGTLAAELSQVSTPQTGARKRSRESVDDADAACGEAQPASLSRLEFDRDSMDVDSPSRLPAVVRTDGPLMPEELHKHSPSSATADLTSTLSPELRELISTFSDTLPALEGLVAATESQSSAIGENVCAIKAEAMEEIERILATKEMSKILGSGSVEDQKQVFQRIARLLHPDKGYVDAGCKRANLALRLALAAKHQIEGVKSD